MHKLNLLFLFLVGSVISITAAPRLSQLDFKAASVLPYYYRKNNQNTWDKYFILSRERIDGMGADRGAFDDFGGAREKNQNHPAETAADEFFEEAIIERTLGMNKSCTKKFVEQNAKHIIAQQMNNQFYVQYIIKLNSSEVNDLYSKFEDAHAKIGNSKGKNSWKFREKDQLASVKAEDLEQAILQRKLNVKAFIRDSKTGKFKQATINLRPVLGRKMRNYFNKNIGYIVGANPIVQIYN